MSGDLAAAYMYEPWISKVMEAQPGARSVVNTANAEMAKTGLFMDVMYMNTNFIKKRRQAALDMLRARWQGVGYWHANTDEVNGMLAEYLKWPKGDIEAVIGTNGKDAEGGIYMYDFDEAARVCGVLDGAPPFGMKNGAITGVVRLTNEWWVKLDLMKTVHDPAPGVDCSLMAELKKGGFRQSFSARP